MLHIFSLNENLLIKKMKFIILSLALALIMGIVVSAQELKRAPIIIKKGQDFQRPRPSLLPASLVPPTEVHRTMIPFPRKTSSYYYSSSYTCSFTSCYYICSNSYPYFLSYSCSNNLSFINCSSN